MNILITDFREPINFLPFIIGSPVTIFWTVFCIIWSLFKTDSFSRFAYLPLATYNSEFYDGLGYDSESTTVHPFTKEFTKQSSFFANKELIMLLLVVMTGESLPSLLFLIKEINSNSRFSSWRNNFLGLYHRILRPLNQIYLVYEKTGRNKNAVKR